MSDALPLTAGFSERFISRADWGARKARSRPGLSGTTGNTLHWEGPKMGWPWTHASCYSKVRGIQAYHMDSKGWADVAYSSIECPHGYIFEGRWFGVRTAANGTNAGNDASYAHCYLGGDGDPYTAEGRAAQRHVVHHFRAKGSGQGLWPHSHWKPTMCPGDSVRAFVKDGMAGVIEEANAPDKVLPAVQPPITIVLVDAITWPDRGVTLLSQEGGVFSFAGAPFYGSPVGQEYWTTRRAARLEAHPNGGYTVVAHTGERYDYNPS